MPSSETASHPIATSVAKKECAETARASFFAMLAFVSPKPCFFKSGRQLVIGHGGAFQFGLEMPGRPSTGLTSVVPLGRARPGERKVEHCARNLFEGVGLRGKV